MKNFFKKTFKFMFGTDNDIMFKINCSIFITTILLSILSVLSSENHDSNITFTIIAGLLWGIWINIVQGTDSINKFFFELFRFCFFFILLFLSLYVCLNYALDSTSVNTICVYFSCFGLFLCICYLTTKTISIINFIKNIFSKLKAKLYNSTEPAPNKIKALIENITAFLVAIGGLTVAIKVITESTFQVLSYFK